MSCIYNAQGGAEVKTNYDVYLTDEKYSNKFSTEVHVYPNLPESIKCAK